MRLVVFVIVGVVWCTCLLTGKSLENGNYSYARPRVSSDANAEDQFSVLHTLKAKHGLKRTTNLAEQIISPKEMVAIGLNGVRYDLNQLKPVSVMGKNAFVTVDGKHVTPVNCLWGGFVKNARILARKTSDGVIDLVHISNHNNAYSIVKVDSNSSHGEDVFVTVTQDDWDDDIFHRFDNFTVGSIQGLKKRKGTKKKHTRSSQKRQKQERLDSFCNRYDKIEVAISFDHFFCRKFGGAEGAIRKIHFIVQIASDLFSSLCIQLTISQIVGFCADSVETPDTYHHDKATSTSCDALLYSFQRIWENTSPYNGYNRDVAHLFAGNRFKGIDSSTLGCTWDGVLCSSASYAVDVMGFSALEQQQAYVFAHEIGHNLKSSHSSGGYVMARTVGRAGPQWAASSRAQINRYVASKRTTPGKKRPDGSQDKRCVDQIAVQEIRSAVGGGEACWTLSPNHTGRETAEAVVHVQPCNEASTNKKLWWINEDEGIIQSAANASLCIQASSKKVGAQILALPCVPNNKKQRWVVVDDGSKEMPIRSFLNHAKCIGRSKDEMYLVQCTETQLPKKMKWHTYHAA